MTTLEPHSSSTIPSSSSSSSSASKQLSSSRSAASRTNLKPPSVHVEERPSHPPNVQPTMTSVSEDLRERKRRLDMEEMHQHSFRRDADASRARYGSDSPPSRVYGRADERHPGPPRTGNGHAASPGMNPALPTFSELPHSRSEEEDLAGKRRRLDYDRRNEPSDLHYAARGGARGYPDERYGSASDRRSIGDDSFDSSIPLARRRGDAAQAKASRLHIDTGYSPDPGHGSGNGTGARFASTSSHSHPSSSLSHHGVKSAPPYKVAFSERDQHDVRGEMGARPFPPSGANAPGSHYHPTQSGYGSGRREGGGGVGGSEDYEAQDQSAGAPASALPRRGEPVHPAHASHLAGPAAHAHSYRGIPPPGAATPLTATRNAFVPQTATLPSPAYHTTQFVRQAGGAAPTGNGNGTGHAVNGNGGPGAGPRTAGLNPPMTARLPEHLRSPPSSKTQFLSLFSNFYDSLQDSRTLKATLEDQVRRSNTLLQTLQRSARVLEITVERRLTAERSMWEAKVQALEDRCRRLERATGAGSPTPSREEERSSEDKNGEGERQKKSDGETSPASKAEEAKTADDVEMTDEERAQQREASGDKEGVQNAAKEQAESAEKEKS